jgi:ribosomal protein S19
VHNGETFIRLLVTEDMVGHRFGAFATKKRKHRPYSKTQYVAVRNRNVKRTFNA